MGLAIDHLFTLVADRARAAATLRGWGFDLTEAGTHRGRGTSNHLVLFRGPYWELLAVDAPVPVNAHLQALLASGAGLLGCALATSDIKADSERLRRRGIDVADIQDVERPVRVGNEVKVARFRVALVQAPASFAGYFFFCQHLTPELVWSTPLPAHPNGACELVGLTVVSSDPQATAITLAPLFESEVKGADGCIVHADALPLHCITPEQFMHTSPGASWRSGAQARFAGITLRVGDIASARALIEPVAHRPNAGTALLRAHDPSLGQMVVTWRSG